MKVAGVRLRRAALLYVLIEDVLIVAALLGAFAFAHFGSVRFLTSPLGFTHALMLLVFIKAAFFWSGLYDFRHIVKRRVFWRRLAQGFFFVALGALALCAIVAGEKLACFTFLACFVPAVAIARTGFELLSRSGRFRRRMLVMGVGDHAQRTAREIIDLRNRDFEVAGFLGETSDQMGWRIGRKPVLGLYSDLESVVERERIDQVVVAVPDRRKQLPLDALLRVRLAGVEIVEEPKVHEEIAGKIPVEDLRPSWLIFSEGFSKSRLREFNKRVFDLVVAVVGLVLSAPFTLLTALAIRLESPGPVIFSQVRVGQGGREFTIYKFRSMCVDAEKPGQPQWAQKNDARVTRVGKFIRKTRLDEIPQMWNVLQGTMSFVGPRPERPYFVDELRQKIPFFDQRHAVKPGITGWAQVRFRYGNDETDAIEKLRHDMFYVKHHSILFDLRVLLETVRVVFERNKGW